MPKELEIIKLRDLLIKHNIAHEYEDEMTNKGDFMFGLGARKHIEIYEGETRVISVIYGEGTYGYRNGLLEIMGLLTPDEEENDSVVGYLTAANVFNRIRKYYTLI